MTSQLSEKRHLGNEFGKWSVRGERLRNARAGEESGNAAGRVARTGIRRERALSGEAGGNVRLNGNASGMAAERARARARATLFLSLSRKTITTISQPFIKTFLKIIQPILDYYSIKSLNWSILFKFRPKNPPTA